MLITLAVKSKASIIIIIIIIIITNLVYGKVYGK